MFRQGPDFLFEISEVEIARVDCSLTVFALHRDSVYDFLLLCLQIDRKSFALCYHYVRNNMCFTFMFLPVR